MNLKALLQKRLWLNFLIDHVRLLNGYEIPHRQLSYGFVCLFVFNLVTGDIFSVILYLFSMDAGRHLSRIWLSKIHLQTTNMMVHLSTSFWSTKAWTAAFKLLPRWISQPSIINHRYMIISVIGVWSLEKYASWA